MCGNSSTTDASDIVCNDFDYYSSAAGSTFMDCIECLQTSNSATTSESDVEWFLCTSLFQKMILKLYISNKNQRQSSLRISRVSV